MKGLKKSFVSESSFIMSPILPFRFRAQLNRKSSQDSSSSKSKDLKSSTTSAAAPPPPPNTAKPLPQPLSVSLPGASVNNSSNHSLPSQGASSSTRSNSTTTVSSTSDRRYSAPANSSPIPPIVVVSSDPVAELSSRSAPYSSPERTTIGLDGNPAPPRANTLNRLRSGPRDTIPIVGKPPRKQRSSRFVVTEKVEIEKLPPFAGSHSFQTYPCRATTNPIPRNSTHRALSTIYQEAQSMPCIIRLQ